MPSRYYFMHYWLMCGWIAHSVELKMRKTRDRSLIEEALTQVVVQNVHMEAGIWLAWGVTSDSDYRGLHQIQTIRRQNNLVDLQ